jgi:hypothetical protein
MKRLRLQHTWCDFIDFAALWAIAVIVFIEMVRLIFVPNSVDGIVLVLSIIVLLGLLK